MGATGQLWARSRARERAYSNRFIKEYYSLYRLNVIIEKK
jgi:hypothetical protein